MRKNALFILGAIAFLCLAGNALRAQTARAWADSTSFLIGDAITVHVEVTHPPGAKLTSLVGDTLGSFHVLARNAFSISSSTTTSTTFTVAAYDSGTAILPPIQFAYSTPADSTSNTITTNPLIFNIHLVEVDTTKEIKDIKPVLSIPLTVAEISLVLGAIVGLVLAAYSIYTYTKRKKAEKPEEKYVPPPKAAHILALEELALLKEKRLWQQGLIKPYYSEVTEITRRYFENRFGFMALEYTTDETMANLHRYVAAQPVLALTNTILRRADLVKFAKYQPGIPEHEEMLTAAYEIIDRTRGIEKPAAPTAEAPVEKIHAKEAAHV